MAAARSYSSTDPGSGSSITASSSSGTLRLSTSLVQLAITFPSGRGSRWTFVAVIFGVGTTVQRQYSQRGSIFRKGWFVVHWIGSAHSDDNYFSSSLPLILFSNVRSNFHISFQFLKSLIVSQHGP